MSGNLLKVQPIRNGTVIDHIEAGRGRKILDILELGNSGTTISLLINVQSKKQKRKDIIKVEDRELDENEIEKLALLSPKCHVNIIRNYTVSEKIEAEVPKINIGIAKCNNQNCISNNQRNLESKLELIDEKNFILRCMYCRRGINGTNLDFN